MSKRKTAYREEWEIDSNWLTKCKENISKAYCTICKQSFNIDNSELVQVRAHAGTDSHKDKVKIISDTTSQRVIVTSDDNIISLGSNKNILLSTGDRVICAETLQALDCVQSNYSFANANNDNEKFKQMFS